MTTLRGIVKLRPLTNITLIVVAVTYGLLLAVAVWGGPFALPIVALVALSSWRFGYEVLRYVAQGRAQIPAPAVDTINPIGEFRFAVHAALFLALATFVVIVDLPTDSAVLRWCAIVVLAAVFPASATLVAVTGNLATALNPFSILSLMGTLGRDYAVLLGLCVSVTLLPLLIHALSPPGFIGTVPFFVSTVWALLAVFALAGAALHRARDDIEIPGERMPESERLAQDAHRQWQHVLDRGYMSIRSGLLAEGYATIAHLVAAEQHSTEIHEWVFNRMIEWEDGAHALAVARRFIEHLLKGGRKHTALRLFIQCRHVSKRFRVEPRCAALLAEYARSIGHDDVADDLSAGA